MTVVFFALGAALLFGIGSVVQQHVAFDAPPGKSLRLSLLWWLVRQPLWLVGVGTALVGNLLSGAALGLGTVTLVQPLLVSRLLFAVPLSAVWARQKLARRDWLGVVATAGGLAIFIAVGRPQPGDESGVPAFRWIAAGVSIAIVAGGLVLFARRVGPARKAAMLGAGAGMLFGLQSGLTHTAVGAFLDTGLTGLLLTWATYTVAVTAVLGTLLAQSAYEMAPLAASYPALAAVEPLTGIGIGLGVLGGSITVGALPLLGAAAGLIIMVGGIFILTTSSLVTGQSAAMQRRDAEEKAERIEEEIDKDLRRLDADVGKWQSAKVQRKPEFDSLREGLRRIDGELDRLGGFKTEMEDARTTVDDPESEQSTSERSEHKRPDHVRAMDRWQDEMNDREDSMRQRAAALKTRIDEIRHSRDGEGTD